MRRIWRKQLKAAQIAEQWREHRKAKVSSKRKSEEDATARKHKSVKTSMLCG